MSNSEPLAWISVDQRFRPSVQSDVVGFSTGQPTARRFYSNGANSRTEFSSSRRGADNRPEAVFCKDSLM